MNACKASVGCVVATSSIAELCTSVRITKQACRIEEFHVDQASDVEHIHPPYFCERCQAVLVKAAVAAKESKVYLHLVTTYEWSPHSDVHCQMCTHMAMQKKGGWPPKGRKKRGRPTANSAHTCMKQLEDCTQASYLPDLIERSTLTYFIPSSLGVKKCDLECPVCMSLVNRPFQLACGVTLCTEYIYR